MEEELGGTFVVSVDELGLNGLWSTIKDLVEARMPLQGLVLPNKVGKAVAVPRLPLMFVLCTDKRLLHLKQYSHSPVTWFRNPMTHLVLVSTADPHEYRSTTRALVKRVTSDIERDWGGTSVGSEWLILYVRPFELDASDRGARKVYEKLCDDFGSKRRERVVRLDVPLRAFDGPGPPSSGGSSRLGATRLTAAGTFVGPGGSALAAGLDELCAGLRDSIRAAFEARKATYDAEVRRLHNERRDPKWSFTTLYLVKDSFALMLEGAGLWEDGFQEYVELETVYLDCLEAAAQGSAHNGGVGSHADFGLTGPDVASADVATLLTSSWRTMRGLVLRKRNVQEFQFRQYLFAAQARVLLRLNRPVDVLERGLVFVQNFLNLLAGKEAAGLLKPWFKECWTFSACVSLITAITAFMQRRFDLPADWEVQDLMLHPGVPSNPAAAAALRQLTAADGAAGGGGDHRYHPTAHHSTTTTSAAAAATSTPLPPAAWQLGALDPDAPGLDGLGGSGSGSGAAAGDDDVPPLDLALLCGRAILPGNLALLLQEGEPRRELTDRLYCCLLGHLYHLARGELLRLGAALQLPEAAAANASILQLGKAAFSPPKPSAAAAAAGGSSGKGPTVLPQSPRAAAAAAGGGSSPLSSKQQALGLADRGSQSQQQSGGPSQGGLTGGVDLLLQQASVGVLSPRIVTQLQELLLTPLCGFSMMINKYADGSSDGLTYEVHTPRREQDPLAAALHRADSQSTPYLPNHTTTAAAGSSPRIAAAAAGSPALSPFSRNSSGTATASTAAAAGSGGGGGGGVLERLRRVGSSSGSIASSGSSVAAGAAAAGGPGGQQQQQGTQQSRLRKVTGDVGQEEEGGPSAGVSTMQHQDSCTSLATVNFGGNSADGATFGGNAADGAGGPSFSGGQAVGNCRPSDDVIDDISLSGASVTSASVTSTVIAPAAVAAGAAGDAVSVADSASSIGAGVQAVRPAHARTQSVPEATSTTAAAAAAAAAGTGVQGPQDLPSLPKVAIHARSSSALPATGGAGVGAVGEPAAATTAGSGAAAAAAAAAGASDGTKVPSPDKGLRARRAAAPVALQPATVAAAAAVPGWVGEWRLQLALRNAVMFQELVLSLSRRAAWCYAKAGRVRSSALIYADVAVLALQRGQVDAAASLLDRMHHIFASEGWQQLLGVLLPKLLACQCLAAQPMLPFTALRLLALKPGAAAAADRQAAFEELLLAVGASPATAAGAAAVGLGSSTHLLNSSTMQLATLSAIQMRPAPGTFSHFFGHEALQQQAGGSSHSSSSSRWQQEQQRSQLVPVLSPPARPLSSSCSSSWLQGSANKQQQQQQQQQRGAALLVLGDSLAPAVDVVSTLPAPVLLQRPLLSLVQLHKSSWISSSPSGMSPPGGGNLSGNSSGFGFNNSSKPAGFSPDSSAGVYGGSGGTGFKAGPGAQGFADVWDALKPGSEGFGTSPRVLDSVRWQEGEELVASRLLAAFTPGGSNAGGCGSSGGSSDAPSCRLSPDGTAVLLCPGLNRLVFQVAPVQEGLYCLKQLRALLGVCGELIIGLPPPGALSLLAAAANLSSSSSKTGAAAKGSSGSSGSSGSGGAGVTPDPAELPAVAGGAGGSDVVQLGGVTSAGSVVSEVVVARVVEPAPRVTVTPVVPEGSLPVGSTAWLGLLVTPLQHHTLSRPRLHLQPNRLLALAAAAAPGGAASFQQQQQQQGGMGALGAVSSSSSEQQQMLFGVGVSNNSSSSSSSLGHGGHWGVQQQQAGHYVYAVPLQAQREGEKQQQQKSQEDQQQQQQQGQQQQQQEQQLQAVPSAQDVATNNNNRASTASTAGGRWLQLRRGCVDLSEALAAAAGELAGPLLLWMQVLVGSPPSPHAVIKVATLPAAAAAGAHAAAATAAGAPAAAAAAAAAAAVQPGVPPKVWPQQCVLMASRTPDAVAELSLQLEYTADAGVWRSHASSLQLPLQQPINITASALQLPSGAVALNMTLSLDPALNTPLVLHQAGLRPQFGLILGPSFSSSGSSSSKGGQGSGGGSSGQGFGSGRVGFSEAVPLVLVPGGTAGLSFMLLPDPGDKLTGSFEADGCNLLLLTYSSYSPQGVQAAAAAAAVNPSTGLPLPLPPSLRAAEAAAAAAEASATGAVGGVGVGSAVVQAAAGAAASKPPAGANSLEATATSLDATNSSGSSSSSMVTLRLPFWLEFPTADDSSSPAAASVMVTLLGPHRAKVGQPVTLSWQLARIAAAEGSAAAAGAAAAAAAGGGVTAEAAAVAAGSDEAAAFSSVALEYEAGAQEASQQQQQQQQQQQPLEADELLCYELCLGPQQQQQQGPAVPVDPAAAAAADVPRSSGASSAAVCWGCSAAAAPGGVVRLGRAPGSLAVVEVVLVPAATGRVSAPHLVLKLPGGNQVVLLEGGSGQLSSSVTITE